MGFISGFTGGVTVTLGLAYLTVLTHERNRQSQALYLRSQTHLLNSLLVPDPVAPAPYRTEIIRESRSTLIENAKVRWNEEIENAVRWIQHTNWDGVREGMEDTVARLLGGGLQRSRENIDYVEKRAGPIIHDGVEKASVSTKYGVDKAYASVNEGLDYAGTKATEVASITRTKTEQALANAKTAAGDPSVRIKDSTATGKAEVERAASATRAMADDAAISSRSAWDRGIEKGKEASNKVRISASSAREGTADATRGAVRDAVNKGIEKGKEIIDKAQEAVGMVSEKVESRTPSTPFSASSEEEALRQRYEKSSNLSKTVEQALAERYTPIGQRDNTVLRGV